MVMTHVDLIEKLLKFVFTYPENPNFAIWAIWLGAQVNNVARYNPAERDTRKLALD